MALTFGIRLRAAKRLVSAASRRNPLMAALIANRPLGGLSRMARGQRFCEIKRPIGPGAQRRSSPGTGRGVGKNIARRAGHVAALIDRRCRLALMRREIHGFETGRAHGGAGRYAMKRGTFRDIRAGVRGTEKIHRPFRCRVSRGRVSPSPKHGVEKIGCRSVWGNGGKPGRRKVRGSTKDLKPES